MSKPTCRELLDGIGPRALFNSERLDAAEALAARIERLLALHGPPTPSGAWYADVCVACGELWPCPTRRALDGVE